MNEAAAEEPRATGNPEAEPAQGVATEPTTVVEEEASRRTTRAVKSKRPNGADDCGL